MHNLSLHLYNVRLIHLCHFSTIWHDNIPLPHSIVTMLVQYFNQPLILRHLSFIIKPAEKGIFCLIVNYLCKLLST